ncbi:MAG: hypothetical protein MSA59_06155 [Lachnobacterium sp.]|nr:hypothetical protein [Lachnobacterium sp.]
MAYWVFEYGKVLIAYIALMYIWPMVVFRRYLAPKSRTYKFAFCTTVQVILINTVVLLLGLVHILNRWTMILFFYGGILVSLLWKRKFTGEGIQRVRQVLVGTRGVKLFLLQAISSMRHALRRGVKNLWRSSKGKRLEYLLLGVVVLFGMIYFSYGAFVDHSYGFGDMYTHHAWIYGLLEGKIFSAGIYPEAMHCFIYAMHQLFGIRVYSCMLFVAGVHVSTLLIAIYCFLKEVLKSRYTSLLIIASFLVLDLMCIDEVFSMARLQWTLPQEFALYTQFLCALYLVRYLRTDRNPRKESGKRKWVVWDENLFLFMMALAASFAIHFYVTIMAFFLCASFAVFLLHRIFRKGNFRSLVAAVFAGIFIAAAPMGVAYATGIPFQGSIDWALNVISGEDTKEGRTQQAEAILNTEQGETVLPSATETKDSNTSLNGQSSDAHANGTEITQKTIPLTERLKRLAIKVWDVTEKKSEGLYSYGYATLYGEERADWILRFTALAAGIGVVCCLIALLIHRKIKIFFEGYLGLTLASIAFMILYAAPFLGLPELIAGARVCSTGQLLILAMMFVPVDLFLYLIGLTVIRVVLPMVSIVLTGAIYVGANYFDVYHGFLYNELTRYNSVVDVTNNIIKNFPQYSYTIVSPTDELYQVIEYGRHEEIYNFVKVIQSNAYSLPSEYIFLYVEKKPIQYAQSHFYTGPEWLAKEKYTQYYTMYFSEGNQLNQSTISDDYADRDFMFFLKESQNYSDLASRTILESKLNRWCKQFEHNFPNDINTYYEDDDFVCYVIRQNTSRLFNLEEE